MILPLFLISQSIQMILVIKELKERLPALILTGGLGIFIIGQIILFVGSNVICYSSSRHIDGEAIQTLFNLGAVLSVWKFWDQITEDEYGDAENPV